MPLATYSTHSDAARNGMVYGDDWPAWQRDLYPFTYKTDAAAVRRELAKLDVQLAGVRSRLHWQIKANRKKGVIGGGRVVASYRRELDQLARYIRNGETQLRLIAANPLTCRELDNIVRLTATPVLERMVGAQQAAA